MFSEKVKECLERRLPAGLWINDRGITNRTETIEPFSESSLGNIQRLMKEIPILFQKNNGENKYWNTNTNSAREKIEEWREYKKESDKYCPAGDFIIGMLMLDYEFKPDNVKKYPELVFNASYRNMMKYECECGLDYTALTKLQHQQSAAHKKIMKKKQKEEDDKRE